jgi:ammonia channel protein AmtB
VAIVYSFVVTFVLMLALKATIGVRVSESEEAQGLDLAEHGETAYHSDAFGSAALAMAPDSDRAPAEVR